MTWIDDLFTGIKRVLWEGAFMPQHQRINFRGSGVQVEDSPGLGATDVIIELDPDDFDGDRLDIDWDPTHYTPDASPPEAFDEDDLTAHLAGIDNELGDIEEALEGTFDPNAHAATHENGGSDEIDVTGLSGLLADPQTPIAHSHPHGHGSDDIANESGVDGETVSDALDNLEAAIGTGGAADAWPSACALVFDFTKPATVAVNASVAGLAIASDLACNPGITEPPTGAYIDIGTPTGNEYPITAGYDETAERYLSASAAVPVRPGYCLIRVCAEAGSRSWICVEAPGSDASLWMNLSTGAIGTDAGDELVASAMTADGDSGYLCDVLIDTGSTALTPQIYVCDADASKFSTEASVPAIILKQFDLVHGTCGVEVIQRTVERIDSIGSRRTTCAWQDENEASQPPLFDGYTPLLATPGALFAGNQASFGINAKRLRILDPAGAYDLVRQLSAVAHPWTLYVVCTLPDDDAYERVIFNLGAEANRGIFCSFYDGNVVLRSRQGGTETAATIAQPVGAGMHLFAFYYGGGTLRVGADDQLGTEVPDVSVSAEPFTVATLGGSGEVAFYPLSECRALMQVAIVVPEKCDPFSTDDTAIRAKLATDFSVTTLLGT